MNIPKDIKFELEWSYTIPENIKNLFAEQKDWNQTLITKINEVSAMIVRNTDSREFVVESSPEILNIIETLEYYNPESKKIGNRYDVVTNNYMPINEIYVFSKDLNDLKEVQCIAPGGLEYQKKPIDSCSEEEVDKYKSKLIFKIKILNYTTI